MEQVTTETEVDLPESGESFESLGLSEAVLRAVHDAGYRTPTPIQRDVFADSAADATSRPRPDRNRKNPPRLRCRRRSADRRAQRTRAVCSRRLLSSASGSSAPEIRATFAVLRGGCLRVRALDRNRRRFARHVVIVATPGAYRSPRAQTSFVFSRCWSWISRRMLAMGFGPRSTVIVGDIALSSYLLFSATISPSRSAVAQVLRNPIVVQTPTIRAAQP